MARVMGLKPGQKLCISCRKHLWNEAGLESVHNVSTDSEDFKPRDELQKEMNDAAIALGCSPIKSKRYDDNKPYVKSKVNEIKVATQKKLCQLMDIPAAVDIDTNNEQCNKCKDFDQLIELIKEKC